MTVIDLYKFVNENNLEYHQYDNDVILFMDFFYLEEFNKLLGPTIFDDDGISCVMKDGYLCFMMQYICDYYGIELIKIFDKQ